jgi:signal peptidase I
MSGGARARRLRRIGGTVLLGIVALTAMLTIVIPAVLGARSYTVLTGSMRPHLPPGTLVASRPTPFADIRIGDIVTYQLRSGEPELVTHRVIGLAADGDGARLLVTRGDANDVSDAAPVRAAQVRGVVIYAVPYAGYLNVWGSPTTKALIVGIVGLGVIGYGVVLLVRPRRA